MSPSPCGNILYSVMCFTKWWTSSHICSWMTEPVTNAPLIPGHDIITCLNLFTCGCSKQVFFEHSTTPVPLWNLLLALNSDSYLSHASYCSHCVKLIAQLQFSTKICHSGKKGCGIFSVISADSHSLSLVRSLVSACFMWVSNKCFVFVLP